MYRSDYTTGLVLSWTLLLAAPLTASAQGVMGLPRAQPNRPAANRATAPLAVGLANIRNTGPDLGGGNVTLDALIAMTNGANFGGMGFGQGFAPGGMPFNAGGFGGFGGMGGFGMTPFNMAPPGLGLPVPMNGLPLGFGGMGFDPAWAGQPLGFGGVLPFMNLGVPIGGFQPVFGGNPFFNPYLNPNLFNPVTNPLANPFFAALLNPAPGPAGTTGVNGLTNPFQALYGPLAPGHGIFP